MCQAFASEQRIVNEMEKDARAAGYKAFHEGKDEDACPKHPLDFPESWKIGYSIAEYGGTLF